MICPKCNKGNTSVIDSRGNETETVRLRKCKSCGYRFYTSETCIEFVAGADKIRECWRNKYGN